MKPTDKNIAELFDLSRQTIASYRKNKTVLYKAMLEYYIKHEVLKDGDSSCFEHQVSEVLLKNNKDK